ncbi:MAG: bifunctional DNA-formamidopyrimidine glycosylase/DNA-(apurinic or apyrimidinic site) lyase [Hyphomicrobiaceae bacterium]|nr:bifunctional DNA-formamidopyrimidine glycosylase/DNA-(apurinic or apyrimidinic site) lyase [Hyphomicrobiaceae bacterium]
MPELPEVETVRRGLEPLIEGQRIVRVEQRRPDLRFPLPENFAARLEGKTITTLARRAKYLQMRLSSGETLVMHLGMTGRFTVSQTKSTARTKPGNFTHEAGEHAKHDHVVFHLKSGTVVTYNDARRFGFMLLMSQDELETHPLFAHLGVEPFGNEFNADYLARRAAGKGVDLKAFLMDQRIVAGLGNIYVCEALHRAGLSPNRGAKSLADRKGRPTDRAERLVPAVKSVLTEALAAGGSTLRDYRHANGELGYFQHSFSVYGRTAKPCKKPGCRGIVRRSVSGGRSTFFCSACQK